MLSVFYSTMAQVCFTLLGLWWVVLQFKYQDLMRDRRRRQMAYDTSLYFVLPGIMSLVSLLEAEGRLLWRVTFASAAVLGAVQALFTLFSEQRSGMYRRAIRLIQWGGFVLYALVAVVALLPDLVSSVGLEVASLQVEGIFLALLVFLGVNTTWAQFAGIGRAALPQEPSTPRDFTV